MNWFGGVAVVAAGTWQADKVEEVAFSDCVCSFQIKAVSMMIMMMTVTRHCLTQDEERRVEVVCFFVSLGNPFFLFICILHLVFASTPGLTSITTTVFT